MSDVRDRHADHDPELIAVLLDRDATAPERSDGEALIASCGQCAALHRDLIVLSSATRIQPTPLRPRAFTLSVTDAQRLAVAASGEPVTERARLAAVMTIPDPAADALHARHDPILVATLADRSIDPSARAAGEALVASCDRCAALRADLVALSLATRSMPTPGRPRDFRLTPEDAARLRPSGWRRFIAAFGGSRDAVSRPLAVGLTTLGIVGLLVGTAPNVFQGLSFGSSSTVLKTVGTAVGSPESADGGAAPAAPAAAASAPPVDVSASFAPGPVAAPDKAPAASALPGNGTSGDYGAGLVDRSSSPPGVVAAPTAGSGGEQAVGGGGATTSGGGTAGSTNPSGPAPLVVVSGLLVLVGLALFLTRWSARRLGDR